MKQMSAIGWVAFVLVVVGGLNWGLIGTFSFDLVSTILGVGWFSRIVYILVGLSAIYMIFAPAMTKSSKSAM